MSARSIFFLTLAVLTTCADAVAQTASEENVTYEPSFFSAHAPQSALDMVRRVPGFALSEGEDRRGYAASAGNVLINGAAPAGKTEDLDEVLERIPADHVLRLELVRGGGANASNAQATMLNVVLESSDGEGVWQVGLSRADDRRVTPSGQISWTGRLSAAEYALAGAYEVSHTPIDGAEKAFDDRGVLDSTARERILEDQDEGRLSAEVKAPAWDGELSLNGSFRREDERERQTEREFDEIGAFDQSETAASRQVETIAELALSHRREGSNWAVELNALTSRRWLDEAEAVIERDEIGAFEEAERADRSVESGETIARAGAERDFTGDTISLAAEVAFNTLEQAFTLTEDDGGGPVVVPTPVANTRIEEFRGELSATGSWRLTPRWTIEAGSALELSLLEQRGDVVANAEFVFFKPSVQLTRALGAGHQLRFRVYRDVGQLDFEDFATSSELGSSIVDAGNPDLRPETSWRAESAGDWRFTDSTLGLTAFAWAIQDALDFVPVGAPGAQFDARGNIGDATLYGVKASFESPAPLIANARLRGEGLWQHSEVNDPLTGARRPQSEIIESSLFLEFRQDLSATPLSWGVTFERERLAPEFRLDRVSDERDFDEVELWVERRLGDLKLRLFAESVANARATRSRTLFDPDRLGAFDGHETRVRDYGPVIGIEMQGAF